LKNPVLVIRIKAGKYATAEGIWIGSSLEEVEKVYGERPLEAIGAETQISGVFPSPLVVIIGSDMTKAVLRSIARLPSLLYPVKGKDTYVFHKGYIKATGDFTKGSL
jgi:hypothetical protein